MTIISQLIDNSVDPIPRWTLTIEIVLTTSEGLQRKMKLQFVSSLQFDYNPNVLADFSRLKNQSRPTASRMCLFRVSEKNSLEVNSPPNSHCFGLLVTHYPIAQQRINIQISAVFQTTQLATSKTSICENLRENCSKGSSHKKGPIKETPAKMDNGISQRLMHQFRHSKAQTQQLKKFHQVVKVQERNFTSGVSFLKFQLKEPISIKSIGCCKKCRLHLKRISRPLGTGTQTVKKDN